MFFNHLKSDFFLVRSLQTFHSWLTMNWSLSKCGFSEIDVTMTMFNKEKNFEIDKIQILHNLDMLLKIRHQELNVWCLANTL